MLHGNCYFNSLKNMIKIILILNSYLVSYYYSYCKVSVTIVIMHS